MAIFNYLENNGSTVKTMKKSSADSRVNEFEMHDNSIGYYDAIILVSEKACSVCQQDKNKIYDIKNIIDTHPLPHENCTCSGIGCSCTLVFTARRDEEGNLIFRDFENKVDSVKFNKTKTPKPQSGKVGVKLLDIFKLFKSKN